MMTRENVLKIAELSKLRLKEEEIEKYRESLNKIFDMIDKLEEVDVTGVKPLFNVLEITNSLREDVVFSEMKKEEFLKNAPEKDGDFIIVPKIIGESN